MQQHIAPLLLALLIGLQLVMHASTAPVVSHMEQLKRTLQSHNISTEYKIASTIPREHAMFESVVHTITLATMKALSHNSSIHLAPTSSFTTWWQNPSGRCTLNETCAFQSISPPRTRKHIVQTQKKTWTDLSHTEFYLNGAGLLWTWSTPWLAESSGCWAAAVVLNYIMRPSPMVQDILDVLAMDTQDFVCCAHSAPTCASVAAAHPELTNRTIITMRPGCEDNDSVCLHFHLEDYSLPVRQALQYHLCARSDAIIGHPTNLRVKIAMLLGLHRHRQLPAVYNTANKTVWEDAVGFASCTTEELFKEVVAAETSGKLHQQPPPKEQDIIKTAAGTGKAHDCFHLENCTCGTLPEPLPPDFPLNITSTPDVHYLQPHSPRHDFTFGAICAREHFLQQVPSSYQGPVCCGYGHGSGLSHIRHHPALQSCRIVVLAYSGGGKDWLQQPEPAAETFPGLCYVAVMDAESARLHRLQPAPHGLMQHGVWQVATMVNSPYWDRRDTSWSPRRQEGLFKLMPFRLFPDTQYVVWVDAQHNLRWKPQQLLGLVSGDTSLALFAHPERDCSYDELATEDGLAGPDSAHLKSSEVLWGLYVEDDLPRFWGLASSAVMVRRNTAEMRKYDCMAWSLTHNSGARDTLVLMYMLHKMGWKEGEQFRLLPRGCIFQVAPYWGS